MTPAYRQAGAGTIYAWEFTTPGDGGHDFSVETKGNFVTNDDEGMLRAALQGVGLIQHMDLAVRKHLEDGSLVRVLKSWCPPFPGFYLYAPSREMPRKVRALLEFLVEKRRRSKAGAQRRI